MVDDQHESEAEETRPSVDDAMSEVSGDMAKTPSEDDPTGEAVPGASLTDASERPVDDDEASDATSDVAKSPDA